MIKVLVILIFDIFETTWNPTLVVIIDPLKFIFKNAMALFPE